VFFDLLLSLVQGPKSLGNLLQISAHLGVKAKVKAYAYLSETTQTHNLND
jgi:hypothetical protein